MAIMDSYATVFSVEETNKLVSEDSDQAQAYSIKFEETQWIDDITDSFELFEYLMNPPSTTDVISSQGLNIFRRKCPSVEEIEEAISNHAVSYNAIAWDDKIKNFDTAKLAKSYMALFAWVINYAKSHYEVQYLPTVFIIDEINRGEVSKIFGELFFSIDPGYRGEFDANGNDNKVQTQYQNMIEEGDVFKNGFYVPENVYIIGTMNDIDRSVEDMDFAMQRRFAKIEVTAEESYQNMIAESKEFSDDEKKEIKARMTALNNAILEPELGLGEAYQIGAAYFRKLLYYKGSGIEQAFSKLWDYHLKGLLSEYLRGNHNSKTQLETLKAAYDNKVTMHEESNKDNG
ncbi:MAG: AAA family ATPase [Bacteroidaceae bacterium]|nr:AAA family ATPase [Bacteroidaceae bacterium]